MQAKEKKIIGRIEKIDLPNLSLYKLDAKIDTGAYTSSLHCHDIEQFVKEGKNWVKFYVLDPDHPEYEETQFKCAIHKVKKVKSSNGQIEERVIIKQQSQFDKDNRTIELSLTDRSVMKYPVLIGRKFLKGQFIVDVSKKYLLK
ncbi:ATP-dependent zinc protease family protein [Rhodohalobacter sulfatireducens]|uniref:RimK/LysX family protein n=1 Tax=Rhodohalobacter sulfatireducens TaxID=2911366 RepID=A0ABS9KG33_9BACT|nr:RimK/LysX family protein [Rhodohalobacter sulfatireducens]MCG2589791.1 RimK/LysX family protein [Rhodohalobacter sulfatireducens]